jgi:hypothetical protein
VVKSVLAMHIVVTKSEEKKSVQMVSEQNVELF